MRLARHLGILLLVLLLGGLLSATLVRLAPGFGMDEQQLDTRLSASTQEALRRERAAEESTWRFYLAYLRGALSGDLGISRTLGSPVSDLLRERVPVTFTGVGAGLAMAWLLGLSLALVRILWRSPAGDLLLTLFSGIFLCVPSALIALAFLHMEGPLPLALAVVVFPRIFRYARNLLLETFALPHVVTARAAGLAAPVILLRYVFRPALPRIASLAGVSVSMALGAAVPMEVICDSPGIGQLAWQAALARDLPLLVNLTLLVTLVTLAANAAADLAVHRWEKPGR